MSQTRKIGFPAIFACLVLLVAGFFWLRPKPAPAPPLAEVLRSNLVTTNGVVCRKDTGVPFTGLMLEKFPSGEMQSRSELKSGRLDGLSEGWFTNGVKQVEEHFSQGVSNGPRGKWYENGKKLSEATIINGKIEGLFKRWHESGEIAEEVRMSNGLPEGVSLAYYPSGFLKARANMKEGKVVDHQSWNDREEKPPTPAQ